MERHADDPFVLLGINTGDSKETFRKGSERLGVHWLCAFQGPAKSPIADLYQVLGYPTIHVLDAQGRIRAMNLRGEGLDRIVAELLAEMRSKPVAESSSDPQGTPIPKGIDRN